jgi:hypothetical protein
VTLISVITALAISSLDSLSIFAATGSLVEVELMDVVAVLVFSASAAERGVSSFALRSRMIASFCSLVKPAMEFSRERPSVGEADSGDVASGNLGTGSSLTGSGLSSSLTGTGSSFFVSTGCTGLTSCFGSGCLTALLTRVSDD